ncbi:MAG: ATP-binding protein [Rickettsiales bacterium]|nr:ATP-binding protein [Rickettsiales bacterium]
MDRVQEKFILKDLEKKIVLLVGPRQAGKTWLAKKIAKKFPNSVYLNYDQYTDRKLLSNQSWLDTTDLLILDELHKMPNWKNYLKGLYDTKPDNMKILVTGSARLDIYDKLGDSLAGRYFRHRLLPLSLSELRQVKEKQNINLLLERGGFPEAYLAEDITDANRWRLQYITSLLNTDVFEFDNVHNFKALKLVFDLLRHKVGSPVSYQSLAEDVQVSSTTIKKYIQILEALFIVFRIVPYSKNIARSLLKEPKIYFFDTGLVQGGEGTKLENLVAISLLKHVYGMVDYKALNYDLHYLRTKDGHEVDFALAHNDKIEKIIEVKLANREISKTLLNFHDKYGYEAIQIVKSVTNEYQHNHVKLLKAENFLNNLFL